MLKVAHVQRHPNGPRLYVGTIRLHHGATGCLVAAVGLLTRRWQVVAVGAAMAVHDGHDVRLWFTLERSESGLLTNPEVAEKIIL